MALALPLLALLACSSSQDHHHCHCYHHHLAPTLQACLDSVYIWGPHRLQPADVHALTRSASVATCSAVVGIQCWVDDHIVAHKLAGPADALPPCSRSHHDSGKQQCGDHQSHSAAPSGCSCCLLTSPVSAAPELCCQWRPCLPAAATQLRTRCRLSHMPGFTPRWLCSQIAGSKDPCGGVWLGIHVVRTT
jgi:hypothetical protein